MLLLRCHRCCCRRPTFTSWRLAASRSSEFPCRRAGTAVQSCCCGVATAKHASTHPLCALRRYLRPCSPHNAEALPPLAAAEAVLETLREHPALSEILLVARAGHVHGVRLLLSLL